MKKYGYIICLAACLTAGLLTSCIREEEHTLETAYLNVALTRAAADGSDETDSSEATSSEQGDGIEDVMIWAFKCTLDENGIPTDVQEGPAAGWRYLPSVNSYSTVNVHVPLPMCDGEDQDYVLLAVLNTKSFGEIKNADGNALTLGSGTTYEQLTKATFNASSAEFWSSYPDDYCLVPENMPVSNWATFTISNDNTHPDKCYELTMPVYRAVAKTQLLVNKSSEDFGLCITEAKIVSAGMPQNGCVFTKQDYESSTHAAKTTTASGANAFGYPNQTDGWEWWGTVTYGTAGEIELTNSTDISVDENGNEISSECVYLPAQITTIYENDEYDFVGSAFIYENENALTDTEDYATAPTGNNGYYLAITYVYNRENPDSMFEADGSLIENVSGNTTVTRYVALPKIVRNHDYQIKATVQVNVTGTLIVKYLVTDWETQTINVPSFN